METWVSILLLYMREKFAWPSSSRLLTKLLIFFLLSSPISFIGPLTMEWGVTHLELHREETESAKVARDGRVMGETGASDSSCFSWRNRSGRTAIMISCSFELRRCAWALPPSVIELSFGFLLLSLVFSSTVEPSVWWRVFRCSASFLLLCAVSDDASSVSLPKNVVVILGHKY